MALGIPTTKAAFDAQKTNEATAAMRQFDVATANASREVTTFTDATGRGIITLENFGRTFDNATRKVFIWQLAIMAVYGTIRKIGETIQIWRDFEVTLARISITTEAVGSKLQQYFTQVADVAIKFGMPIRETLTGMDLALRATSDLGTGAKRTATAISLLESASALANITGMKYGQSIDILVGSLRQTGLALDKGIELLDKWVAVAKNAAVSVNDLSQGFAIMADAGRAAGLTVDQINGLIAALSETVTLGPVQVGNAIRAIMSTLYNPSSISLLQKYGVAVRRTTGEVRSFWEVMTQLSAMKKAEVLDEAVWLEIAKAAGAGQRRYAQFLALLNNWDTAIRASNISMNAQGQAMDANEKIVETLTNTFDKFVAAQNKALFVLGQQTGIIEDFTGVLQDLTDIFNKLSTAPDIVWNLGRAIMFLVGTLGALKVITLAMGWLNVGPRIGSMLGRFGGITPSAVAHSPAAIKAIQAGGYATAAEAEAAGIAILAPRFAARAGMLGLAGLLGGPLSPLRSRIYARIPEFQNIMWKGGAWRTAAGRFAPVPYVAGQPFIPMTWGRVGRALISPMSGLSRAIGSLGAGAAAYGLTGEPMAAAGAAIGAGLGSWIGGPLGMAVGGAFGTFIGKTIADSLISEEDRIRGMFKSISEEFSIDLSEASDIYFGKISDTVDTLEEARKLAERAAPESPIESLIKTQSWWSRLGASLGFDIDAIPFLANQEKLNEDWKRGAGALYELNEAVKSGIISQERFQKIVEKTSEIGQFAWDELTESEKALVSVMRMAAYATGERAEAAKIIIDVIGEQIQKTSELAKITNRYSESQLRIKELMTETGAVIEGMSLKEWEQKKINELLEKQVNMTAEGFQDWYKVLVGSAQGYSAHVEAIERLSKELGLSIERIPEEKWLLIQRWDPTLSTNIVETMTTLQGFIDTIDKFKVEFPDILTLSGVDATIDDIEKVQKALQNLYETTGEERYDEAIQKVSDYIEALTGLDIESRKLEFYTKMGAQYQRPTQVRLVSAETIRAYREQLGRLEELTALARSLGKVEDSVLTLVDPLTGDMLRLEENTLALEMLGKIIQENTDIQEKRLEAEYNLPSWYARPTRYWYYRTTGSTEFGPQQESLWAMWEDFVKARSKQSGGGIPQTGAYYLHKGEAVLNSNILATTNNILIGSHQVLVNSQNYLSQINMGIISLREEIASLRSRLSKTSTQQQNVEGFSRVVSAGQGGDIPTFGARGLLD